MTVSGINAAFFEKTGAAASRLRESSTPHRESSKKRNTKGNEIMNRAEEWKLPLTRCPDAVKFQFEDGEVRAQALGGGTFEAGGAALRTDAGAHRLRVTLTACE